MKIAMIKYDLENKDGGSRQLLWLAREFKRLGHEVKIYANVYNPDQCYPEVSNELEIQAVNLESKERKISLFRKIFNIDLFKPLDQLVALMDIAALMDENFDIVNPHESPAHWVAVLYKRKKKSVPIVWTCNDAWIYLPARLRQIKQSGFFIKREIIKSLFQLLDKRMAKEIDLKIVLDHRMKGIIDRIFGADSVAVHPGIDIQYLEKHFSDESRKIVLQKHNLPKTSFIVLCSSILHPYRHFEDAIVAVKKLLDEGFDIRLILVGYPADPAYAKKLRDLVEKLDIKDKITFVFKFVREDELFQYYQACDVYVFPHCEQTWGMAVIEASVFEKPSIISRGAGVHEVFTDGENALLVPPMSAGDIALKLKSLILNEDLRKKLSKNARDFVYKNISWKIQAEQMALIFKNLLEKTPK